MYMLHLPNKKQKEEVMDNYQTGKLETSENYLALKWTIYKRHLGITPAIVVNLNLFLVKEVM